MCLSHYINMLVCSRCLCMMFVDFLQSLEIWVLSGSVLVLWSFCYSPLSSVWKFSAKTRKLIVFAVNERVWHPKYFWIFVQILAQECAGLLELWSRDVWKNILMKSFQARTSNSDLRNCKIVWVVFWENCKKCRDQLLDIRNWRLSRAFRINIVRQKLANVTQKVRTFTPAVRAHFYNAKIRVF